MFIVSPVEAPVKFTDEAMEILDESWKELSPSNQYVVFCAISTYAVFSEDNSKTISRILADVARAEIKGRDYDLLDALTMIVG